LSRRDATLWFCPHCRLWKKPRLFIRRHMCHACKTAQAVAWNAAHRTTHRLRQRRAALRLRLDVLRAYSGRRVPVCASCPEKRLGCLTLSHISALPRPFRGLEGQELYRRLRDARYPKVPVAVECMNCNLLRDNFGKGYLPPVVP
jgi:hypothetical protein